MNLEILACPVCKSPLRHERERLACVSCNAAFPVVRGIPVLINDANSVFAINQFTSEQKTFFAEESRLRRIFFSLVPELTMNIVGKRNYSRLAALLAERGGRQRVLVVGGSIEGAGMKEFFRQPHLELYETDVAFGPRAKIICDAHDLPFRSGVFDCAIAQAVLEHVADPYRCVEETRRVLKPDGLVYAESPFLYPAHAVPYDFHRFTYVGHRRLFRGFEEIASGPQSGPGQALALSYQYFLLSFSTNKAIRAAVYFLTRWTAFWLKYLDLYLSYQPESRFGAAGFYFLGKNSQHQLSDKQVVAVCQGKAERP